MADRAMLAAPALLVLLPLALAGCPCPPAPAASKVCGSNFVTYDSQCHLDCAALPGLSVAYPGPCSLMGVMSLLNITLPSAPVPVDPRRRRFARSAKDDLLEYMACWAANECTSQSCGSACGTSDTCQSKCVSNCQCDCRKMPGSDANPDNAKLLQDCMREKGCTDSIQSCSSKCRGEEKCTVSCIMDVYNCLCECNRLGSGSGNDDKRSIFVCYTV